MLINKLFENSIKRFKTEYSKLQIIIEEIVSLQLELQQEIENKIEYLKSLDSDTDLDINVKYVKQNSIVSEIEKHTNDIIGLSNRCEKLSEELTTKIENLIDEIQKSTKIDRTEISAMVYKKITDN